MEEMNTRTPSDRDTSRERALWPLLADWVQQSTLPSARPGVGAIVSVLICTSYQTLLTARLSFAGTPLDQHAYTYTRDWYGALTVAIVTIGAAILLLGRSRRPLAVLLTEAALYAAASTVGMSNYLVFPLLFALFSCITRPPVKAVATGLGAVWAVMTFSALITPTPAGFVPEYLGQLLTALATAAVAVATRSIRGWRNSRQQARDEELRAARLRLQRDQAVSRTRIAAELHDSVGHGLTTIIALAEGLTGTTGDPTIDEALTGINTVARESLDETRRAVRALTTSTAEEDSDSPEDAPRSGGRTLGATSSLHDWAEILPVLERARTLGVTVVFTETGKRPHHPRLADLCFTVTREAVTNAIRHSPALQQIAVAWDHDDRSTTAAIRSINDPGATADNRSSVPGTGLSRLQREVEATGGSLSFGWVADGEWVVNAVMHADTRPSSAPQPGLAGMRGDQ